MIPIDPIRPGLPGGDASSGGPANATRAAPVFFDRRELNQILNVYGRMVAAGEWRDYAFDSDKEAVSFCIYRRASEMPLYRIEKRPKLARRQGAWSVISATGHILKRGQDLDQVLRVFDRKRFRVVED